MVRLGLTGSIGMGKTTTSRMFADLGARIYDADVSVHTLYAPGGAAVEPVGQAFPGVVRDGAVDRARLATAVTDDPAALARLEAIVHPLLRADREALLANAQREGVKVVVLDIPLLFETGADRVVDAVVVVSAPREQQRERVLARRGMDAARLEALLSRQIPDAEKRARADFVIDTGQGLETARAQVAEILRTVLEPGWRAARPDR